MSKSRFVSWAVAVAVALAAVLNLHVVASEGTGACVRDDALHEAPLAASKVVPPRLTAAALVDAANQMGSAPAGWKLHDDDGRRSDARATKLHASGECEPAWIATFNAPTNLNGDVYALTVFDDGLGGGPALYAGGSFTMAGGMQANHIAKWNGASWAALGNGTTNAVFALMVFDDGLGGGPALYAGGDFAAAGDMLVNNIAKWDGAAWSPLGAGTSHLIMALTVFDDDSGGGPALYAGGWFTTAGGVPANCIAKWDGTSWSALGSGVNDAVMAMTAFDDGSGGGPALFVGGQFTIASGVSASRVAKWDGDSWSALGSGISGQYTPYVLALTVFDDGSGSGGGPALYASGKFDTAGGVSANHIARWSGTQWSALGSGIDGTAWTDVWALTVFDDAPGSGGGPALYAGGNFITVNGFEMKFIAKWDGAIWSAVGNGTNSDVLALAVFDIDLGSGSGPALYVGGRFTTAGGPASRVAKWNGTAWSGLGNGVNDTTYVLTIYDDSLGSGTGPALYAGGSLTMAGGLVVNHIAGWDGEAWSSLGSGMNGGVFALTAFDDAPGRGSGPALYAGGIFTTAGGVTVNRIAKWNASSGAWSGLGGHMVATRQRNCLGRGPYPRSV